jgi:hypothetical protein
MERKFANPDRLSKINNLLFLKHDVSPSSACKAHPADEPEQFDEGDDADAKHQAEEAADVGEEIWGQCYGRTF